MHLEFAHILRRGLTAAFGAHCAEYASTAAISPIEYSQLEMGDVPKHISAMVTSHLPFPLAKVLFSRLGLSHFGPLPLAEKFAVAYAEQGFPKYFTLEVSESGHLNADLTGFGLKRYLQRMVIEDPGLFFSGESSLLSETHSGKPFPIEFQMTEVFDRVQRSGDIHGRELCGRCLSGRPSDADRLMLLGLLADPELDVEVYLLGLSGRQNVGWYLDRFREDLSRLNSLLGPEGAGERPLLESAADAPYFLQPAIHRLLRFRQGYFLACYLRRPELLLQQILFLVRDFYSVFNQPQFRSPEMSFEARAWLRVWSRALEDIVDRGLQLLS